jgi:shikimate dehydrogenase
MHMAAYRTLGLPHTYERLETKLDDLPARIDALRRGEYAGFSVTLPLKERAIELADVVDDSARYVGAANTLARTADGLVVAHNTEVAALAAEIRDLAPGGAAHLGGKRAIVIGTGGAARAAVVASLAAGVEHVYVRGRTADRFVEALQPLRVGGVPATAEPLVPPETEDPRVRVILQATSCGMVGGPPGDVARDAVAWSTLVAAEACAIDVIYAPPVTPLLARARAAGVRSANGLGMLARQGATAFALWLGVDPPLDVMLDAIR